MIVTYDSDAKIVTRLKKIFPLPLCFFLSPRSYCSPFLLVQRIEVEEFIDMSTLVL